MSAALQDTTALLAIIFALLAAAVAALIFFTRGTPPQPRSFDKNCELRHLGAGGNFLIPEAQRPAWLGGAVVALILIGILSWTTQRDDTARRDDALSRLIANTHCATPDAPLEKLVLSIGTEADGGAPTIACVYVTGDLGTVPKLREMRSVRPVATR